MPELRKNVSATRGKYLYAVVSGSEDRAYGQLGINGGTVYTISDGHVAAVVSDVPNQKIRPERRHFAAHQSVLKRLLEEGELLPMSFGVISDGPKAVRTILSRNRRAILHQLRRVSGKTEMGLRIRWDVPNIFEYLVMCHEELRQARDELLATNGRPNQDQKIELGRMFEDILTSDRDRYTAKVEEILRPHCSEMKRNRLKDETEVTNLACLVPRDNLGQFEAAIFAAASCFDDSFAFDYNGPWAPHNFVDLNVDL